MSLDGEDSSFADLKVVMLVFAFRDSWRDYGYT